MQKFNEFVKDENDIEGLVSFALYMKAKIDAIENYKKENGGTEPDVKTLDALMGNKSSIKTYQDKGTSKVKDYLLLTIAFYEDKKSKNSLLSSYGHAIAQNAIGNLIWAIILFILFFVQQKKVEDWLKQKVTPTNIEQSKSTNSN